MVEMSDILGQMPPLDRGLPPRLGGTGGIQSYSLEDLEELGLPRRAGDDDLPWASSPKWGQNITFALNFPVGTNPAGTIVPGFGSLQAIAKYEYIEESPRTTSIHFGFEAKPEDPAATNTSIRCVARVDFGSGAGLSTIFVDWRQGTALTITANAVSVWPIFLPFGDDPDPSRINLSLSITQGTVKSFAIPTFTLIAPGSDTVPFERFFPVPPFAKVLNLFELDALVPPASVYGDNNLVDFMTDTIIQADPPAALTGQSVLTVFADVFEFLPQATDLSGVTIPSLCPTVRYRAPPGGGDSPGTPVANNILAIFGLGL